MKEIRLHIDCENTKCGNCSFLYNDLIYKNNYYCRLFEIYIGNGNAQEVLRSERCLKSDVENKIQPAEIIRRFNVRNLKEKQEKNCRVCKKSVTTDIDSKGRWFGKCKMAQELGALVDDTIEMTVCDCFEQREGNQ